MTNIAILSGNLGNDPETSANPGDIKITHLSLATSRPRYVDGEIVRDGERRAERATEWHRAVAFESIAKAAEKCEKGMEHGGPMYLVPAFVDWIDDESIRL